MAIRSAQGAGAIAAASRTSKASPREWWVMGYSVGLFSGTQTAFQVFGPATSSQAAADVKRYGDVGHIPQDQLSLSGPFATRAEAQAAVRSGRGLTQPAGRSTPVTDIPGGSPSSWLSGIGAQLASGLEAGFVQFLKDIWQVIEGPVLIAAGVIIILFAFSITFKNDLAPALGMVARFI